MTDENQPPRAPPQTENEISRGPRNTAVESADGRPLPWVEKYRPERLRDVLAHEDIIKTIRRYVDRGQLPHLLFHGPPGTGKTSTILAVAKEFYGSAVRTHVLELNASDDRGINTVREQIKTFAETTSAAFRGNRLNFGAKTSPQASQSTSSDAASAVAPGDDKPAKLSSPAGSEENRVPNPLSSVKLIVLDEADQMTTAAQNALRRIMEAYARNVRFCLICNYINKITPAIQSRCTGFRFTPLASTALSGKAAEIAKLEGMTISPDGMETLIRIAKGDMRRLLNCMQVSHLANPGEELTADSVHRTLGYPPPSEVTKLFERLLVADFFTCCKEFDELVTLRGYTIKDWVQAFYERVIRIEWPVPVVITFITRLADIEERLAYGASELVQLHALTAAFFEARAGLHAAVAGANAAARAGGGRPITNQGSSTNKSPSPHPVKAAS
ncbi:activator 1 36 [Cystoisospora suis]|uniref:Activator 1 36 n=1 Tax=Cystoisospora suis TaxID=483139 RepID=A0A2C6KU50_9APIC|nr:activator 1 36 [Cystoisospora suis]